MPPLASSSGIRGDDDWRADLDLAADLTDLTVTAATLATSLPAQWPPSAPSYLLQLDFRLPVLCITKAT